MVPRVLSAAPGHIAIQNAIIEVKLTHPSIDAKTRKATEKLDITLKKEILLSDTLVAPQNVYIDSLRIF